MTQLSLDSFYESQSQNILSLFDTVTVNVMLVGDTNTGKSQFLNQYVNDDFSKEHKPTIGTDWLVKSVFPHSNQTAIKLKIYDTAGQERFRKLTREYYRDAQIIILFVDVTRSFHENRLEQLIDDIKQQARHNVPVMVVMSKSDLEKKFTKEELKKYLNSFQLNYTDAIHDISAETSLNGTTMDTELTETAQKIINSQCELIRSKLLIQNRSVSHHRLMGRRIGNVINNHPYKAMVLAGAVLGIALCATSFGTAAFSLIAFGVMGGVLFGLATFIVKNILYYNNYADLNLKAKMRLYLQEQIVLPKDEINVMSPVSNQSFL